MEASTSQSQPQKVSWPDTLKIQPINKESESDGPNRITFSIASFNVLAEAYLTPRSHVNLPPASARIVFDKQLRRKLLCKTLAKLAETFDILCLQELDDALRDAVAECLSKLGFGYVIAPREGIPIFSSDVPAQINDAGGSSLQQKTNQKHSRSDGCATFYNCSKWKCINYQVIKFDDLAEESRPLLNDCAAKNETSSVNEISEETSNFSKRKKKKLDALSGIIASYRRRNAALIIEFEQKQQLTADAQNIIVANAHLYWHPGYEYVKLSQAHYLVQKVKQFAVTSSSSDVDRVNKCGEPAVIICGDMNSKPNSVVHQYFTEGFVDARVVAPWNFHFDEVEEQEELAVQMKYLSMNSDGADDEDLDQEPIVEIDDGSDVEVDIECNNDLVPSSLEPRSNGTEFPAYDESELSDSSEGTSNDAPPVRYLLDITLNKFTRWLRILGLDATLETADEEKLRTGEGKMVLFERSRKERRILITTSKTLMTRRDCPPGTYLVYPSNVKTLEQTLLSVLLLHGVTLYPKKFLTRCVVCNGKIIEVFDRVQQKAIFDQYASPVFGEELDHVFKCNRCDQGYWWSSSPTSSASRVKDACTHLLKLCLQGCVRVEGHPEFFSHVDYDAERQIGEEQRSRKGERCDSGTQEVLGWLKDSKLQSPFSLRSSYADETGGKVDGEMLPFTNVTSDFVGALDYILFEPNTLQQVGRLEIPTDLRTLNTKEVTNGHLLPSDEWPSDHLCIGSQFLLKTFHVEYKSNPGSIANSGIPSAYVPEGMLNHMSPNLGCNCGCVPKILSLFQMAELRKQAKLKKDGNKL